MPEYLSPGVYVEEVETGPPPIEGVSTSTAGMVGIAEWGPIGTPTLVVSFPDYTRQFGGYLNTHDVYAETYHLPHAVRGFFDNEGQRVYIVRVLPPNATTAAATLFDRGDTGPGFAHTLVASAPQGDILVLVEDSAGMNAGDWFVLQDGARTEYRLVTANALVALQGPSGRDLAAGVAVTGCTHGGPSDATNLTADVPAGATALPLANVTNYAANDVVRVGTDPNSEIVVVQGTAVAGGVPLVAPLAFPHPSLAAVARLTGVTPGDATVLAQEVLPGDRLIVVTAAAPLAGTTLLRFGAGPDFVYSEPGTVLVAGTAVQLANEHGAAALVAVPTLNPIGGVRNLTADAAAGDATVQLDDRTGITEDGLTVLHVGSGAGADEHVVVLHSPAPHTAAAPDPGPVVLGTRLHRSYAASEAAAKQVQPLTEAKADTNRTWLARPAHAGESALVLIDSSGFAPGTTGTLVRLGRPNDLATEYLQLAAASKVAAVLPDRRLASSHDRGVAVAGRAPVADVEAVTAGTWGNGLRVWADDDDPIATTTASPAGAGTVNLTLGSTVGIEPGSLLEFYTLDTTGQRQSLFRQKVDGRTGGQVTFAAGLAQAVPANAWARTREFRLDVAVVRLNLATGRLEPRTGASETFRQLSMDPRHSRYFQRIIGAVGSADGASRLIRVADNQTPAQRMRGPVGPDLRPGPQPELATPLSGGDDQVAAVTPQTFIGVDDIDPAKRTGLAALQNIEEISIVAIPGQTSQAVQNALIVQCEQLRYRFAVLDSAMGESMAAAQIHRNLYDTKYAAFYFPWLKVEDPFAPTQSAAPLLVPPSGHVICVYARTDDLRGVHKAPANEVISGIDDLEVKLLRQQQDILNPRNINVLRDFRDQQRAIRIWGARCATSDPEFKYVNVRRLFIFLEASLDRGTQWVVFEPNDELTWARVRQSVSMFLTTVWRNGALMGRTAEQAFFVKCDRTTMTQDDIDNGRLILIVGVAPVKPAEFVIIRISQWAGGAMAAQG